MPRARRAATRGAAASRTTQLRRRVGPVVPWLAAAVLAGACSSPARIDPAAAQPPQPKARSAKPVKLGAVQTVSVSSSFGPGTTDVPVTISVLRFRDRIRPTDGALPLAPASHWASAEVRVCRPKPVVLGYPAWVLGDDSGRTAQLTKILHPGFPQPPFPNASGKVGCAQGWVTWVTQDVLHATQVRFEQTRDVPGAWRLL